VRTRGPGASTIRVPIILDHEGEYPELDPYAWPSSPFGELFAIAVSPNPVRFRVGSPGEVRSQELCISPTNGATLVTDFRVIGEGLDLVDARDRSGLPASIETPFEVGNVDTIDIQYTSNGSPLSGLLAISFINEYGTEMTLGVPVIICE